MPKITFLPTGRTIEVAEQTKLLACAIRNKIPIRYGCGACRCGTCAVKIDPIDAFVPMEADEKALLSRLNVVLDGSVRLACRSRKSGEAEATVDLDFQHTYQLLEE